MLRLALLAAPLATLIACGNAVTVLPGPGAGGATGSGSTTGSTSGTSTSRSGGAPGDCADDAGCMGGTCAPITPGGYKICRRKPPEATKCHMMGGIPDQCCTSKDCKAGACYSFDQLPSCGGAFPAPYNSCVVDECQNDAGCATNDPGPRICLPAGAFGYPQRRCLTAYCKTDADCSAKPGGRCLPIANPCCAAALGLACVYPGGCSKDSDCGGNFDQHCAIDPPTKSASCKPGGVGCPA